MSAFLHSAKVNLETADMLLDDMIGPNCRPTQTECHDVKGLIRTALDFMDKYDRSSCVAQNGGTEIGEFWDG